jgi:hypothetical protein
MKKHNQVFELTQNLVANWQIQIILNGKYSQSAPLLS